MFKPSHCVVFAGMLCSAVLLTSGCASGPAESRSSAVDSEPGGSEARDLPPEAMDILGLWEDAIRSQDAELLRDIVVQNAVLEYFDDRGNRTSITGIDAITEFRLHFFEGLGPQREYRIGEIEEHHGDENHDNIVMRYGEDGLYEWLNIHDVDGRRRIVHMGIELPLPGIWVSNRYQRIADENRDGFLGPNERDRLREMTAEFFDGEHQIRSPVDEFFDLNPDGFVDRREIERAARIIYDAGLVYWLRLRGNGPTEVGISQEEWRGDDIRERVVNGVIAGSNSPLELGYAIDMATRMIFPDAVYQPVPRAVSSMVDELADGNGDGRIDEREQDVIMMSAVNREVRTDFDRAMDANRDGHVDWWDVVRLLQTSVSGRGMVAEGAEPPYDVRTAADWHLDRNGDDLVDREEIDVAVKAFAGRLEVLGDLRPELEYLFDSFEPDGRVEPWEVEAANELMIVPRPVDPDQPFDDDLDSNGDGFIDPEELGITAGFSSKGKIPPFQERIAMVRRRSGEIAAGREDAALTEEGPSAEAATPERGSEYYRRLGSIQDKKLAVVSLDVGTTSVDSETANGVAVFVENAFVNVGKVRVVDRANIQRIFNEYEFQASGVIDETTAVEIGKLSGADIIVIGSINKVGELYYLNIKMLAVQTAEIMGSSIAQAPNASGFLEMANQAVYNLF